MKPDCAHYFFKKTFNQQLVNSKLYYTGMRKASVVIRKKYVGKIDLCQIYI